MRRTGPPAAGAPAVGRSSSWRTESDVVWMSSKAAILTKCWVCQCTSKRSTSGSAPAASRCPNRTCSLPPTSATTVTWSSSRTFAASHAARSKPCSRSKKTSRRGKVRSARSFCLHRHALCRHAQRHRRRQTMSGSTSHCAALRFSTLEPLPVSSRSATLKVLRNEFECKSEDFSPARRHRGRRHETRHSSAAGRAGDRCRPAATAPTARPPTEARYLGKHPSCLPPTPRCR